MLLPLAPVPRPRSARRRHPCRLRFTEARLALEEAEARAIHSAGIAVIHDVSQMCCQHLPAALPAGKRRGRRLAPPAVPLPLGVRRRRDPRRRLPKNQRTGCPGSMGPGAPGLRRQPCLESDGHTGTDHNCKGKWQRPATASGRAPPGRSSLQRGGGGGRGPEQSPCHTGGRATLRPGLLSGHPLRPLPAPSRAAQAARRARPACSGSRLPLVQEVLTG